MSLAGEIYATPQHVKDHKNLRIIIGSDWRPETKQGIEGKIYRFRLGRVRVRVRDRVRV